MNKRKSLFIIIIIMRTLITVSSNNWIRMWMGLEINIIAFLPLVIHKKYKNRALAAIKYFIIQRLGRLLFIFSLIIKININLLNEIVTLRLLIKLGRAPFHIWIPEVIAIISWNNCIILCTWQKIAPLRILINIQNNNNIISRAIIISAIVGAVGGLNQTSLRKIMAYSSINHLAWIIISRTTNSWIIYIILYRLIIITLCKIFNHYNIIFINQVNNINMTNSEKICITITILRIGGIPPFLGFIPKWITIQNIVNEEAFTVILILIIISLITLIYYIRIIIKIIIIGSFTQKWIIIKSRPNLIKLIIILNLRLPLLIIMNLK